MLKLHDQLLFLCLCSADIYNYDIAADDVLLTFKRPTFNHHTDFSASFSAANTSHYQTYLWPEMAPPESLAAVQAPEVAEM